MRKHWAMVVWVMHANEVIAAAGSLSLSLSLTHTQWAMVVWVVHANEVIAGDAQLSDLVPDCVVGSGLF